MTRRASVLFEVLAPSLSSQPGVARDALISPNAIEFPNIAVDDLTNDSWDVVPAIVDFGRRRLKISFLDSGTFSDVPDNGFNGYRITFRPPLGKSLSDVKLPAKSNTAGIPLSRFSVDSNVIFVNVDNLPFAYGQGFSLTYDPIY
jgi:hypothetical protein